MQRSAVEKYKKLLIKRHESRNQELRHERVAEAERLEGLKKMLQSKVEATENQAA
jgi:hypothetical protein